jgi:Nickel responsive protein SCO4226-like
VNSLDNTGTRLSTFLVEQYWTGVTAEEFDDAAERVRRSAEEIADDGIRIRFLHSTLVPDEETALCVIEAESAAAVEDAFARAAVRFERIVEARTGG